MRAALAVALLALPAFAAESAVQEAQRAQMEKLRGEIAAQIQLQAFDLLDELVYSWTQSPPFSVETPVVLADVSVPVGFGSGLQALIENHFAGLVLKNPQARVILAHCPQCTALVVHSGSKGTIVSRGVDQPETLAQAGAGSGSHHAIFLDFEAEGSSLVLRARITSLEAALPIVYAKTLTTSTSSPAMLRESEHLKSAEEARKEYLDVLGNRSFYLIPIKLGVRTYASPGNGQAASAAPYVWLKLGFEAALSQARAWTASFTAGISWAPQLHVALGAEARVARLISGSSTSLTHPDLYAFVGGSVFFVSGQDALLFSSNPPDLGAIISENKGRDAQEVVGTFHLGVELRVKNRIGLIFFLESLPGISSPSIGNYLDLGFIKFHTIGAEVSFCF